MLLNKLGVGLDTVRNALERRQCQQPRDKSRTAAELLDCATTISYLPRISTGH